MFCSHCGAQCPDGSAFCVDCGASLSLEAVHVNTHEVSEIMSLEKETMRKKAIAAMVLGIIACVLAWYPVTSIAAIILGAMAISKAKKVKEYLAAAAQPRSGQAIAGKITGIVGLVGGILMTIVWALYIVLIVFVVVNTANGTSFYWDDFDLDLPIAF